MPLTPQQQAVINSTPIGQRAAYQQAYEADNAKNAGPNQAEAPYTQQYQTTSQGPTQMSFPSTLNTRTQTNPSGTIRDEYAPNLGPQQHAFNVDLQSQQALAEQELQKLKFGQSKEAFQDRLAALQGLSAQGGGAPRESFGQLGANEAAARAAAFARAKELAGSNALAGLKSVQNLAAERGMTGSTLEGQLAGQALGGGMAQLGDFTREQLIQDLNRNAQVSDMTYQGNIQQRGQDLARQQALFALLNVGGLY